MKSEDYIIHAEISFFYIEHVESCKEISKKFRQIL